MTRDDTDFLSPEFIALAHRGGALMPKNLGIENTLAAFRNAYDLGFRYLETDVHASSDGVLFAFHDVELTRVTDQVGQITDLPAEQLAQLRVGGREPIPTFEEMLTELPQCRFNIDLKSPGAIQPLVKTIQRHKAERRVCVGSFSVPRIRKFRRLMPNVTTVASPAEVALLQLGMIGRRIGTAPRVFQVPLTHQIGPKTVTILTPQRVRAIHDAGRKVQVWTVDSPDVMHDLIDWGVDGIITDRPDLLKGVLRARGMWSTQHGT